MPQSLNQLLTGFSLLALSLCFTACSAWQPRDLNSNQTQLKLNQKNFKVIGRISVESEALYVFNLFGPAFSDLSAQAWKNLEAQAKLKSAHPTIINVVVERQDVKGFFHSKTVLHLSGLIIEFDPAPSTFNTSILTTYTSVCEWVGQEENPNLQKAVTESFSNLTTYNPNFKFISADHYSEELSSNYSLKEKLESLYIRKLNLLIINQITNGLNGSLVCTTSAYETKKGRLFWQNEMRAEDDQMLVSKINQGLTNLSSKLMSTVGQNIFDQN
jgi:hypothetical protein